MFNDLTKEKSCYSSLCLHTEKQIALSLNMATPITMNFPKALINNQITLNNAKAFGILN